MDSSKCPIKYSVIIPVYNAESTIRRCLDSLIFQLREDIELLVMNDGSSDKSALICREYAENHSGIRYLEQENQGVSVARNACLDIARGEYVLFVDSDDFVSESYFETLDRCLNTQTPDLLLFGSSVHHTPTTHSTGVFFLTDESAIADQLSRLLRAQQLYALWNKVFRNQIIQDHQLRFNPELAIGEDVAFILPYTLCISSLASINTPLYIQDISSLESLSRKRRDYVFEHLQNVNDISLEAVRRSSRCKSFKTPLYKSVVFQCFRSVYSASKELLKYDLSASDRRQKIRTICDRFLEKKLRPLDWKCYIIALPVRLRMARVIDFLIRKK